MVDSYRCRSCENKITFEHCRSTAPKSTRQVYHVNFSSQKSQNLLGKGWATMEIMKWLLWSLRVTCALWTLWYTEKSKPSYILIRTRHFLHQSAAIEILFSWPLGKAYDCRRSTTLFPPVHSLTVLVIHMQDAYYKVPVHRKRGSTPLGMFRGAGSIINACLL